MGRDKMIRREFLKLDQVDVQSGDERRGRDRMIRQKIFAIDQVRVLSGDGRKECNGMIKWEIFEQLTKFTYDLETDKEEG